MLPARPNDPEVRDPAEDTRGSWIALAGLTLVTFLLLLDDTAVAVAGPAIQRRFGLDLEGMQWVVNVYTLTIAAFILLSGQLADRFGRPRVYLAGPPFADDYRRRAIALVTELGWEPVDPMRRDFRGRTVGNEREIVEGDLADIDSCDAVLAAFTAPDEGTAMEAWYAHSRGIPVVAYTGGTPAHPWAVFVSRSVHASLEDAVASACL